MIAHLRGRLLEKHPNRVIVEVQGVGYEVHVPLSTFYGLAEPGSEISLRVHTHVREDALLLYGFATMLELQIFERLIASAASVPSSHWLCCPASSRTNSSQRSAGKCRAAHGHSRHRQENGRTHRARAEGQDGFAASCRCARARRADGRNASHRRALGADEPWVSSAARRAGGGHGDEKEWRCWFLR